VVAEERQREVVRTTGRAEDEPTLDEPADEEVESRSLGQRGVQPAEWETALHARHGFQHPLLGRGCDLEAVLEEGQVELVDAHESL
jgi:hypothetical protein